MAESYTTFETLLADLERASFDRPAAIVCNAHITGLGVARALSQHDVPVIAVDRTGDGVAPPSTAVDYAGRITYPLDDLDGFRDDIEAIADALEYEPVAFPCMDEWVHAFVGTEPAGVELPFAGRSVIDGVLNKHALYDRAEALGVAYPETYRLDETDPDVAADRLGFPLVVKPALKREFEEAVGTNVIEVADRDEFDGVVDRARRADISIMAQEKVPIERGADRSLVSYVPRDPDREPVTFVGNPAVRYPLAFGTSCVVRRTRDPDIEADALELLRDAEYHGISEAEFVYDRERETYVLLDINTRPWKWIGLPVAAGANLPWAAYAETVGEPYRPDEPTDATWVYLPDYLTLLATNVRFDDVLSPADWRALVSGSFETDPTLTTGIYSPSDPGPTERLLRTKFSDRQYYCSC